MAQIHVLRDGSVRWSLNDSWWSKDLLQSSHCLGIKDFFPLRLVSKVKKKTATILGLMRQQKQNQLFAFYLRSLKNEVDLEVVFKSSFSGLLPMSLAEVNISVYIGSTNF